MSKNTSRRGLLKGLVAGGVSAAAAVTTGKATAAGGAVSLNPSATALMPDGKLLDRAQILQMLNLDPNIAPEAWLAIVACGSNAAAAPDAAILQGLKDGTLKLDQLDPEAVQRLKETVTFTNLLSTQLPALGQ